MSRVISGHVFLAVCEHFWLLVAAPRAHKRPPGPHGPRCRRRRRVASARRARPSG